jgi:hypothetical protein
LRHRCRLLGGKGTAEPLYLGMRALGAEEPDDAEDIAAEQE